MGSETPGPQSKFAESDIAVIAEALRMGVPKTKAAITAGISYECMRLHIVAGRRDIAAGNEGTLDARFALEIDAALAEHEAEMAAVIHQAARGPAGDWHAAAFILTHRFPENWSRRTEVTGVDGGPVPMQMSFDLSNLSDEDLDDLDRITSKASVQPHGQDGEGA